MAVKATMTSADEIERLRRKVQHQEVAIVRLRQIAEQDRLRAASLEDALKRAYRLALTSPQRERR